MVILAAEGGAEINLAPPRRNHNSSSSISELKTQKLVTTFLAIAISVHFIPMAVMGEANADTQPWHIALGGLAAAPRALAQPPTREREEEHVGKAHME